MPVPNARPACRLLLQVTLGDVREAVASLQAAIRSRRSLDGGDDVLSSCASADGAASDGAAAADPFGEDGRAALPGSLHRISAVRDRRAVRTCLPKGCCFCARRAGADAQELQLALVSLP